MTRRSVSIAMPGATPLDDQWQTCLCSRLYALSVSPTHIGMSAVLSFTRSLCSERTRAAASAAQHRESGLMDGGNASGCAPIESPFACPERPPLPSARTRRSLCDATSGARSRQHARMRRKKMRAVTATGWQSLSLHLNLLTGPPRESLTYLRAETGTPAPQCAQYPATPQTQSQRGFPAGRQEVP